MNRLTINIKGFDYRLVTESPVEHIRELEGKLNAQIDSLCAKSDVSLQDALVLIALNLMEADNIDITQFSQMREELESLRMHCSRLENIISDLGIHSTDKENITENLNNTDDVSQMGESVQDFIQNTEDISEADNIDEAVLDFTNTEVNGSDSYVDAEKELFAEAELDASIEQVDMENIENPAEIDTLSSILDELMRDGDGSMAESSAILFGDSQLTSINESIFTNNGMVLQPEDEQNIETAVAGSYISDVSVENNDDIFKEFNPNNTLEQDMLLQADNKYIDEIARMLAKATEEADQLRKEVSCIRQKFLY